MADLREQQKQEAIKRMKKLGIMICFSLTIATASHLDWFASTVMKS